MITVNGRQVNLTTFPNGERKLELSCSKESEYRVVWRYEDDGDFLLLRMLDDYLLRNGLSNNIVDCLVTSMPYERMDRSKNGSVFSLDVAIKLLPNTWNYTIFAPHSDVTINLMKEHTYGNVKSVHVHEHLLDKVDLETILEQDNVIVFPDKGAKTRYENMILKNTKINKYPIIYGDKSRDFSSGELGELTFKDFEGNLVESLKAKSAIVIDDLSSYGGTFIKAKEALQGLGIETTHLFLEKAESSIIKGSVLDYFDSVSTTNLMMDIQNDTVSNSHLNVISYLDILKDY